ncbi:MAG: hypothetical protein ACI8VT_000055 [Saprospiraceae bacterium]
MLFTDPIIGFQLNPPIQSFEELSLGVNEFSIDLDSFYQTYQNIKILDPKFIQPHIIEINYHYLDKAHKSYSYFKAKTTNQMDHKIAISILPGSGKNQSSIIYDHKSINYQSEIENWEMFIFM